jgi:hypothetical protein
MDTSSCWLTIVAGYRDLTQECTASGWPEIVSGRRLRLSRRRDFLSFAIMTQWIARQQHSQPHETVRIQLGQW